MVAARPSSESVRIRVIELHRRVELGDVADDAVDAQANDGGYGFGAVRVVGFSDLLYLLEVDGLSSGVFANDAASISDGLGDLHGGDDAAGWGHRFAQ